MKRPHTKPARNGEQIRQTCRDCGGRGVIESGVGHFGDQMASAGEGWKPCMTLCNACYGFGTIEVIENHE